MTRSQKHFLLGLLLVTVIAGVITFVIINRPEPTAPTDISTAFSGTSDRPATFTTVTGEPIEPVRGTPTVRLIYSWASWSPSSAVDLPLLESLALRFPEVAVVALNRAEPLNTANRFLATLPEFTAVDVVVDTNDSFYSRVGGYAVPETLIYDEAGTLLHQLRGPLSESELTRILLGLTEIE